MKQELWGQTPKGKDILIYSLEDPKGGIRAKVLNYGAILYSLEIPEKDGGYRDVVLGFDRLEDYFENGSYYGALVARCANRIGGAKITLDGKTYELDKNDGNNNLHSGFHPLCKRVWPVKAYSDNAITFSYESPDLDMGFPGQLHIDVTYTLSEDALIIDYHGLSDADTVFNPTNHSYFNLKGAGEGTILDHKLFLYADQFTCTDAESVATGEIREVAGTPMDFREGKVVGDDIEADYDQIQLGRGFDHNFILSKDASHRAEEFGTKDVSLSHAAKLVAPEGDITLDVYTDRPCAQVYSGNFITGEDVGKGGKVYPHRGGLAIETQGYPNALNVDAFPNPIIRAEEDMYLRTVYRFTY